MLINGEFVDDAVVRLETARVKTRLRAEWPNTPDDLEFDLRAREIAREVVIERILLRQASQKDPTPIPPAAIEAEVQRFQQQSPQQAGCLLPRDQETLRADIETELRVQRFLAAIAAHVPKPSHKQVSDFYRYAKESLAMPETIRAAHIVKNVDESTSETSAEAAIRHIQSLLNQGESFETIADSHSDCPGRGGDLGFFARGEMVPEFDDAVFSLPPGTVSEIFRTPFGFHIARVYERRPARIPSLNEARSRLEDSMVQQARMDTIRAFMDEQRAKAEIRKSKQP